MKKLLIILAIGAASITNSQASNHTSLLKEIKQKVFTKSVNNKIDKYYESDIEVNFKIVNHKIKISKLSSSNLYLKKYVYDKLKNLTIDSNYENNKVYKYKFILNK